MLDNSYAEKSSWLKAEFDVVRNLIQRNPRDESTQPSPQQQQQQQCHELVEASLQKNNNNNEISASKVGFSPPAVVQQQPAATQAEKRKFADSQLGSSMLSPEQKRVSADYSEIAVEAGKYSLCDLIISSHLLLPHHYFISSHLLSSPLLSSHLFSSHLLASPPSHLIFSAHLRSSPLN